MADREFTVGDLSAALEKLPSDMPINVNVPTTNTDGAVDGFIPFRIVGTNVGMWEAGQESPDAVPFSTCDLELSDEIGGALLFVPWPQS